VLHNGDRLLTRRVNCSTLQPTLPLLLANLISVGEVAIAYSPPSNNCWSSSAGYCSRGRQLVGNLNTKQDLPACTWTSISIFNVPPLYHRDSCGSAARVPNFEDYPDRPAGDLYCECRRTRRSMFAAPAKTIHV